MKKLKYGVAVLTVIIAAGCQASEETEITFEDSNLEKAVAHALDTDSPIHSEDAGRVTTIDTNLEISSLEGIQQLHAIETLRVENGQIENFEPLLTLDDLDYASLGDVFFTDDTEQNEQTENVLDELEERNVELNFRTRLSINDTDGDSNGLFYEIIHNDQHVYLFGSIHIGDDDLYPIRHEVMNAFDHADSLSVEVDINQIDETALSQQMMNTATFPDREDLSDYVAEDIIEDVSEYLTQIMVPEHMISRFEPWFLTMLLNDYAQLQTDYTSQDGIDQYFIKLAEENEMPVMELESAEEQINAIAQAPMDEQIEGLTGALDTMDVYEEELKQMMNLWRSGNINVFEQLRDYDSEYGTQMMNERDEQMTDVIKSYLNSDSGDHYFVVVGALHLAGENSIPYRLEQAGYQVSFIE